MAVNEDNSEILQLFFDSASVILEELPLRFSEDCQASLLHIGRTVVEGYHSIS